MKLADKHCVPCKGGVPPLDAVVVAELLRLVDGWAASGNRRLTKTFDFPNFVTALEFVNKIGTLAEEEGHHPDIYLSWGKVRVEIWTHKINGLTESDFVLAAKIDEIPNH